MKIKVCGMKYPDNIKQIANLPIDYMGMIFYAKSPRFVDQQDEILSMPLSSNILKVGVFVDADIEYIKQAAQDYNLNFAQLHGNESPLFCKEVNSFLPVIKAFSVAEIKDLNKTKDYEGVCDYFLFDTKTPQHGGSGQKFDWHILDAYTGNTPFLLSGGISAEDAQAIKKIQHTRFAGIDLNSKFETEPGLKDIDLLTTFIKALDNE